MNHRQRTIATLRYEPYDQLPLVHFGYWRETLEKWAMEGHITQDEAQNQDDGNSIDNAIASRLGFDFNWLNFFYPDCGLRPAFESKIVKEFADGTKHVQNRDGVIVLNKQGAGSIPTEINHLLKDRRSWEEHYQWRYQWSEERVDQDILNALQFSEHDIPHGLCCGSLFGTIRNVLGIEGYSYLLVDDENLFDEIIQTVANLCYQNVKYVMEYGAQFDFAHFWEDICFKNGPLISPRVFDEKIGPHYKRITDLLKKYNIDIVSVDCDGMIDTLIPTWIENAVNTMFPIEVGTWNASIKPWREKFGKILRGIGGMNKNVFSQDRSAVDAEIERLKPLVHLGGYIPCPDHRIAPDAQWDLVCYYCDRMRNAFSN